MQAHFLMEHDLHAALCADSSACNAYKPFAIPATANKLHICMRVFVCMRVYMHANELHILGVHMHVLARTHALSHVCANEHTCSCMSGCMSKCSHACIRACTLYVTRNACMSVSVCIGRNIKDSMLESCIGKLNA
jgi:hypothetical protein